MYLTETACVTTCWI